MRGFAIVLLLFLESIICVDALSTNKIIIKSPWDLQGEEISIPYGTTLVFKSRGCILNGTIKGECVTVKAGDKQVFSNVRLKGTFKANHAKSEWFGIKSDCRLGKNGVFISGTDNTESFRNLFLFDNIFIAPGTYLLKDQLCCKSNQVINGCNATLKFLYKGSCILMDGSSDEPVRDVKIHNLHIVGSKNDYSDITEYWMGIQIGYVDNIEIEDVACEYCRGDGFYIGTSIRNLNNRVPRNIALKNVKSYYNHRQGLSITRVSNAQIISSEFCFTSGTAPQSGIDVEPNMKVLDDGTQSVGICENVLIEDCLFKGNNKEGIKLSDYYHYSTEDRHIYDFIVKNCSFEDDNLTIFGISNSSFENLSFKNSVIEIKGRNAISNIDLSNIEMFANKGFNSNYAIRLGYHDSKPQRTNIVLNNIHIKGYSGAAIRIDSEWPEKNGKPDQLKLLNCTCVDCGAKIVYGIEEYFMSIEDNNIIKIGIGGLLFLSLGGASLYTMRRRKSV